MSEEKANESASAKGVISIMGEPIATSFYNVASSAADRLSQAKPEDIHEIAASQIKLLASYYDLVLGQARKSFRWALIAAGIGLAFFLSSVGFLLYQKPQNLANISLISGALIEVISAIHFYLYGKTSAQLATFHTRLDTTQRFLLANSMCEGLEGEFKQKARYELIKTVAGVESVQVTEEMNTKGENKGAT